MSFFRTLLEDEVNILPGHNDGSAEAKELMDEIDAAEINEEEVDAAAEAKFDEDNSAEKIVDEMYMAIAEHEMAWNEFVQESSLKELMAYGAGRTAVNEGAVDSVKDFFSNAKKKVKEFFEKVWSVIKRWASNMFAFIHTNKKFAAKYSAKITAGEKVYKEDKTTDRTEGFPYTNLDKVFNTFTTSVKVEKPNISDEEGGKRVLANLRKQYADSEDAGNFRENVLTNLRGQKDRKEVKYSAAEVIRVLSDDTVTRKAVNKAMTQSKKEFKAAIRELDNLQSSAEKDANSGDAAEKVAGKKNYKKYMLQATNMREQLKILQVVRSCLLSCISARNRQARHIGNLYVRLANRKEHKGFRNESAYGFLGASLI